MTTPVTSLMEAGSVPASILRATKATVEVIDMTGRVLYRAGGAEASRRLATEGLAPGVYTVRVISGNAVITKKLVV